MWCEAAKRWKAAVEVCRASAKAAGEMGEVGSSRGTSLSGWGKAVIAGRKGETGGEPKSISKGHGPPRDSWETEL